MIEGNMLLTKPNLTVKTDHYFSVVIQSISPASTGYHFELSNPVDNVEFIKKQFIPYTSNLGSPGVNVFMFKSVQFPCEYELIFNLISPIKDITEEFKVHVTITE